MSYRPLFVALTVLCLGASGLVHSASTPISCQEVNKSPNQQQGYRLTPEIYIENNKLCFSVLQLDPTLKQNPCLSTGEEASWSAVTLILTGGESRGRDDTDFRVHNVVVDANTISYEIEWSRHNKPYPLREVKINRVTGEGLVRDSQGESGFNYPYFLSCGAVQAKF